MIITIELPDNTIKIQYATQCDGVEQWSTLEFGDIVSVQTRMDVPAKGGAEA